MPTRPNGCAGRWPQRSAREVPGKIDYVVGPAVGGLIPAYETSRHLGVPAIWVEREGGEFRLRRFEIEKGARVVIVEDIVTTGLSIRETIDCLRALGAEVLAAACIIDRSAGKTDVGVPLIALAEYEVPAYPADRLPPELAKIPPVKPGSRNLSLTTLFVPVSSADRYEPCCSVAGTREHSGERVRIYLWPRRSFWRSAQYFCQADPAAAGDAACDRRRRRGRRVRAPSCRSSASMS